MNLTIMSFMIFLELLRKRSSACVKGERRRSQLREIQMAAPIFEILRGVQIFRYDDPFYWT